MFKFESLKKKTPEIEKESYSLESNETVEITAKEITPAPLKETIREPLTKSDAGRFEGRDEEKTTAVFLPGWKMGADSTAVDALGAAFANQTQESAFVIQSRIEENPGTDGDPLYKEALAISRFIKEKGLKNVVLVGHSQGGDKGINLATILQDDPELNVRGLVLLESVGLYEQPPTELTKNFIADSIGKTPVGLAKTLLSNPGAVAQGIRAGNSIVEGIFEEVRTSGTDSLQRMRDEVEVMGKKNEHTGQIRVPIILMSGVKDTVSRPEKIVSPEEEERAIQEWENTDEYSDPREKVLQEKLFPQSPYVRAVFPEKLGHHALPLLRSKSVANASLYLLRRHERNVKKSETA